MEKREFIDSLRLKYPDVKVMPLTTGEKLYWVRCLVCDFSWVAVQEEIDESGICYKDYCQKSFEAKVIRATQA